MNQAIYQQSNNHCRFEFDWKNQFENQKNVFLPKPLINPFQHFISRTKHFFIHLIQWCIR